MAKRSGSQAKAEEGKHRKTPLCKWGLFRYNRFTICVDDIREDEKMDMPKKQDLRLADELLRLRGSSLNSLIKTVMNAIPEQPICVCLKAMQFNERTLAAMREEEEHPEQIKTYNSLEEMIKDSEDW